MNKKYVAVGLITLGLVFFVGYVSLGLWVVNKVFNGNTGIQPASVFSMKATPTLVPTFVPMPQLTPTPTPKPVLGNVWVVVEVGPEAVYSNGFTYVIATFANIDDTSVTILRQCGAPGWPAPEIGHKYMMNFGGVLVPIEGVDSPLQRFYEFPGQ